MKMNNALVIPITSPRTLIRKNNGLRFRNCQLKCRFFRNMVSPEVVPVRRAVNVTLEEVGRRRPG
jgi:hypothetical protein